MEVAEGRSRSASEGLWCPPQRSHQTPAFGFGRLHTVAGGTRSVRFTVPSVIPAFATEHGTRRAVPLEVRALHIQPPSLVPGSVAKGAGAVKRVATGSPLSSIQWPICQKATISKSAGRTEPGARTRARYAEGFQAERNPCGREVHVYAWIDIPITDLWSDTSSA